VEAIAGRNPAEDQNERKLVAALTKLNPQAAAEYMLKRQRHRILGHALVVAGIVAAFTITMHSFVCIARSGLDLLETKRR
jgi:hypothetical protein